MGCINENGRQNYLPHIVSLSTYDKHRVVATFGCNNVSLKRQEEYWIFNGPLSRVMNHAGPSHPMQSDWYITTIWHPNQENGEGYVKFWMVPVVSLVDTTQFYQLLF